MWTTTFALKTILAEFDSDPTLRIRDIWRPIFDPEATIKYFMEETSTTPLAYTGSEQLTYGALVRKKEDFMFLKDAVKDKRFRDHSGMSIVWSYLEDYVVRGKKENTLFSLDSESFRTALVWSACVVMAAFFAGLLLDLKRTRFNLRKLFFKETDLDSEIKYSGCEKQS